MKKIKMIIIGLVAVGMFGILSIPINSKAYGGWKRVRVTKRVRYYKVIPGDCDAHDRFVKKGWLKRGSHVYSFGLQNSPRDI